MERTWNPRGTGLAKSESFETPQGWNPRGTLPATILFRGNTMGPNWNLVEPPRPARKLQVEHNDKHIGLHSLPNMITR